MTPNKTEINDSIFAFPCDFPIKAMGKAADDFDALIVGIVRKYASDLMEGAVTTRFSQGGRFVSVSVTIRARNRRQLDDIYRELSAHERVLVAL
ncbi:MAG: YbeD family protein [Gammaproteobacteria bacterium]